MGEDKKKAAAAGKKEETGKKAAATTPTKKETTAKKEEAAKKEKKESKDKKAVSEDKKAVPEDKKAVPEDKKAATEDKKAVTEDKKEEAKKAEAAPAAVEEAKAKEEEKKEDKAEDKATEKATASPDTNGTSEGKKEEQREEADFKIRLTYFNGAGRAELSRMILAAAGMPYVDRRVDPEEWAQLKPNTPFGQLPILEYEGQLLGQSITIARFLAKKAGLYGNNETEQAFADMITDYAADFNNKWVAVFRAVSYEEKEYLIAEFFELFLPKFMDNAEKMLEDQGGKYFAGENLTYGDLSFFQVLHSFTDPSDPFYTTLPESVDKRFQVLQYYPLISAHLRRVLDIPGIAKWVTERPVGLF